jgi:hypothetical protein
MYNHARYTLQSTTTCKWKNRGMTNRLAGGADQRPKSEMLPGIEFCGFPACFGRFLAYFDHLQWFFKKLVATIWLFQYSPRSVSLEGFGGDT